MPLYNPAPSGGTPAVVLGTAGAAGSAATFVRTDDTIAALDATSPVNIAAAAVVGTNAKAAHSDHTHTIGAGVVTRAMFEATGKNWQFLGQATASAAVRTGTITWSGGFQQLWFEYFISGYSGSAIGRLIVGPTAGLSETGTTFSGNYVAMTPPTTIAGSTTVSIPGWPTAVGAAANVARWGAYYVLNIAGTVKYMRGDGCYGGTAATTAPTYIMHGGLFNDTTNLINKAELAVYDDLLAVAVSTKTFNAGTYLNVWGRNND